MSSKSRQLADLLDSTGDVKSTALDNVPASDDASALTSGTLPADRIGSSSITDAKLNSSKLDGIEAGATADQTKADIEGLGIAASSITGALPAISGANLTNLPASGATSLNELSDATVSTVDPAIDTNPSATGAVWINKTSGEVYVCTGNTSGSNIWVNVGEGADGVSPIAWYGDRGIFAGGTTGSRLDVIDYVTISTTGNAIDFGDLTDVREFPAGLSDGLRGVVGGGDVWGGAHSASIDYFTIATTGNASNFGNLTVARIYLAACCNGTRGVFGGGYNAGSRLNTLDYITVATTGNATDFGDLTLGRNSVSACANETRGVFMGGYSSSGGSNVLDYITIATIGNATDFGDLTAITWNIAACANETRGVFASGEYNGSGSNKMEYITIATTGNSIDFGDLTQSRYGQGSSTNGTRGVFGGGYVTTNIIDYITMATTGNATDFGDLTQSRYGLAGLSGD